MIRFTARFLVFSALLSSCGALFADMPGEQATFFESKIRPILVKHCFECHSAESREIGGGLRLDLRSGMLSGGESGPVVTIENPESSLIIRALRHDSLEMPPNERLPDTVVNDFLTWIKLGAVDPREDAGAVSKSLKELDHSAFWSFQTRMHPSPPAVTESSWPRSPIDAFVMSGIERAGFLPAADAPPSSLIRRLYFDLIGLPPTAEEIDAFSQAYAKDASRAVERCVDELLANDQFGVRWGRHWLDVARYGESNGDDGLGRNATFPHAWRYRDYVIQCWNDDVPYDRFITEQVAGDLLSTVALSAEERNRLLTATGFLAIGSKPAVAMNNHFQMDVVDDQINVISTGVMGLSVACARCHDHKHDPISTRDYYALAGIFASSETLWGAAANEKLTAPPTPLHALLPQLPDPASAAIDRTQSLVFPEVFTPTIESLKPRFHAVLDQASESFESSGKVEYSATEFAAFKEASLHAKMDGLSPDYSISFWFRNRLKNEDRPITAYLFSRASLGDKALSGDHIGIGGNHDRGRTGKLFVFNGNSEPKKSVVGKSVIPPGTWNHVTMVREGERVRLYLNGRLELEDVLPPKFGTSNEFCFARRSDAFAPLEGNLAHACWFDRPLSEEEVLRIQQASGQPMGVEVIPPLGYAMGVRDRADPVYCKIHINGESTQLGPEVPRGFLTSYVRPELEANPDTDWVSMSPDAVSSGRLSLAQWLVHPAHPQTARVIVNRVWLHLMGRGIVETPDDFGVYGARPTHPELLDFLANQFIREGWSVKRLIRSIVMSRTYQLDSQCSTELRDGDPENRFFARHARRRLDAESLRDRILFVTHRLDCSPGKGSAIAEQDVLINWPPGAAVSLHRASNHRSVYLCMLRHAPPLEIAAFDLPDGVSVVGQRETATLPTQSLYLLNNPLIVEHAARFARSLLEESEVDDAARVHLAFVGILGRQATEIERRLALEMIGQTERQLEAMVTDSLQRRRTAWSSFCQGLMSTNEFLYVD